MNGQVHSEICAVPAESLVAKRELLRPLPALRARISRGVARKVDKLSTVRVGSARYSVPLSLVGHSVFVDAGGGRVRVYDGEQVVADHPLQAPGESSIADEQYGRARPALRRPVRPENPGGAGPVRPG